VSDCRAKPDRLQTPAGKALSIGQALADAGLDRADAACLLRAVTGASRAQLIAHGEEVLPESQARRFLELAHRRRQGEPVAYLTGRREFYGFDFEVDSAVLIPRPETELLVDLALDRLPPDAGARVLDLGTGSGAIALALALLRPQLDVVAVDRSPDALAVAKRNLVRLLPGTQRVRLVQGDWYQALSGGSFDLIVSNPPYVAARDPHLGEGDLRFEPAAALVGGDDGLDAIRRVVAGAAAFLAPGGQLLFEHGYDQAPACRRLLAAAGFSSLIEVADLAGIPRVAGGRLLGGMAS
jgi:release factor glutamine methyltransferase